MEPKIIPKNRSFLLEGTLDHGKLKFDLTTAEPSIRNNVWAVSIASMTIIYNDSTEKNIVIGLKSNYIEKSKFLAISSFSNVQRAETKTFYPTWFEIDFVAKNFELEFRDLQKNTIYEGSEQFFVLVLYHRKA